MSVEKIYSAAVKRTARNMKVKQSAKYCDAWGMRRRTLARDLGCAGSAGRERGTRAQHLARCSRRWHWRKLKLTS